MGIDTVRKFLTHLKYMGRQFACPICGGHFRKFLTAGVIPRPNAQCPQCGSFERHRLLWLYLYDRTNLFQKHLRILHIAPEPCIEHALKRLPNLEYLTADISNPLAMLQMDITQIPFSDNSFDVILCVHVLEHIVNDRQAMRELYRVLRPEGWGILQVPIYGETTDEDASITNPQERLRRFGQEDHVRIYGSDYKNRLEDAGFTVTVDHFLLKKGKKFAHYYGCLPEGEADEPIYFCSKFAKQ